MLGRTLSSGTHNGLLSKVQLCARGCLICVQGSVHTVLTRARDERPVTSTAYIETLLYISGRGIQVF